MSRASGEFPPFSLPDLIGGEQGDPPPPGQLRSVQGGSDELNPFDPVTEEELPPPPPASSSRPEVQQEG